MKINYNAPVTLTYTLICAGILAFGSLFGDWFSNLFVLYGDFRFGNIFSYFRLFSYVLGHADFNHFLSNFTFILLIGPLLEEKFGSKSLIKMIVLTALITALINIAFLGDNVRGASGVVFMMIMLSSFTSFKSGKIPLTFVLVFSLFIGKEILHSFDTDNVSQFGHIMGGICGAIFGFSGAKQKDTLE